MCIYLSYQKHIFLICKYFAAVLVASSVHVTDISSEHVTDINTEKRLQIICRSEKVFMINLSKHT